MTESLGEYVSYNKERDEWYYKYKVDLVELDISLSDLRIMISVIEAKRSQETAEVNRELHSSV